jgi:CheY-like chemotaxis protein
MERRVFPAVSERPKILVIVDANGIDDALADQFGDDFDLVQVDSPIKALSKLARDQFAGVFVGGSRLCDVRQFGTLLENEKILHGMPDGVVLLDADNTIIWCNVKMKEWCKATSCIGANFYTALGSPEIMGPDYCPFHTALATNQPSSSTLLSSENRYFHLHAAPFQENGETAQHLVVTIRDVTDEMLQQQKLAAIHQAGIELADLTAEELKDMTVEQRIELLKSNILHFTKDLLRFDVVEIRLLDPKSNRLEPLLAEGILDEAARRNLYASPTGNGVTGYVAATGKSYNCEDTCNDPLYIEGFAGARSSLTVPLIFHDQVIGTFNVESPELRAFSESDVQFLEIFSRDVAVALNTLELLQAEKFGATAASIEAIHSAVALPVDAILNDAVCAMERYIGHDPELVERLQSILKNSREIKQLIQKVGQSMAPIEVGDEDDVQDRHALLRSKHILVVDADEQVRSAAHHLLERYGCSVETAHDGSEAVYMARAMRQEGGYHVIISDRHLPDMSGYDLFLKLKDLMNPVPFVLMNGFGYDREHVVCNARRAGLQPFALLFKPFRLDQLLDVVERMILDPGPADGQREKSVDTT